MDKIGLLVYFDHTAEFVKTNYILFTTMAAIGFSAILLKRCTTAGKCYSDTKLNGKVVIVTGANTGIGKETAKDLASRGAKVILACRNLTKAQKAADDIRAETGSKRVVVKELDLASLDSVRSFAKAINENEPRLDILINNAGIYMTNRYETSDGFELTWHTNHLGPFLLTNLLLDLLKKSAPSRIINVSSSAHWKMKINFDDPNGNKYNSHTAYGQSKLANIMFSNELARRLKGTGVTSYSLHPGFVATEVFRDLPIFFKPIFNVLLFLLAKNSKDGAQTTIQCAVDESLANESGYYYSDCKRAKTSAPHALDEEAAQKLWKLSADMVKLDSA